MKNIVIIISISSISLFSCKKEKSQEPIDTPEPESVSFSLDVQPIFQQSCGTGSSCHGTTNAADGKVFETHSDASSVPNTTIMGSIKHDSGFSSMPKNGNKLTDAKIAIIQAWIDGGKLND